MGKISNALDKYARERRNSNISGLTRADMEVLLAYDRKTCHLLNYHPEDGQMDQQSAEALRNMGTIQRLLANKLIYPNGKLTPKGLRQCERLQKAAGGDAPSAETRTEDKKNVTVNSHTPAAVAVEPIESRQVPAPETPRLQPIKKKEDDRPPQDSDAVGFVTGQFSGEQTDPAFQTRREAPVKEDVGPAAAPERDVAASEPSPAIPGRRKSEEKRPKTAEQTDIEDGKKFNRNLVSALEPQSYAAEKFKILRTSLLYPIKGQPPKSILITSASAGEGKSFVAANLSVSIALNINKHVLLMDCDMRKPDIHRQFGIGDVPGLNEYLIKKRELASLFVRTGVDKLTILPGGEPPSNPSELLTSERMAELIHEVKHRYSDRLIIIDSPPTNLAAETGFLAREVDGIIVVVRHGKTPRRDIEGLLELLGSDKIIGFVLNAVDTPLKRKYGYKGYGKYGGYRG